MGEWLSRSGVAFRCIEYTPFEIGEERFLSFSVAFDRAPDFIYPLAFQNRARQRGYFWHNIGRADNAWWDFLKKQGEITTGFENQPGDEGERILKSYAIQETRPTNFVATTYTDSVFNGTQLPHAFSWVSGPRKLGNGSISIIL